jgi:hypothetical protein
MRRGVVDGGMPRREDLTRVRLWFNWWWLSRHALLHELQLVQQRLQDARGVVVLGSAVRDRRRLMVELSTHLLLGRIDARDDSVQQIQTLLELRERRTGLIRRFPHRI